MILRELLVKLGLDIDAQSFAKGQLAAEIVKKGFDKLVEAGKEAVKTFVENIEHSIEYGDQIKKTSQKIGIATDALQELQYAGKIADVSAEDMSRSIGLLSKNMEKAKDGSAEASKAFKGISFLDHGKLKPTDEVLASIADKFAKMPDGPEKTAEAMALFGRAGKDMIPFLNKGSGELADMREEARALGLVMDEKAVESSEQLADNFKRLKQIAEGLWRGAISQLLPAINDLVKRFLAWRKANAEIMRQRLQTFIWLIVKGIELLADTFGFLIKNMDIIKFMAAGLVLAFVAMNTAAIAAAVSAAAAWLVAAAPFIALAAAIATIMLLFDDVRGFMAGEDSLTGDFVAFLDDWLKPKATDTWFVKAIKYFIELLNDANKSIAELFSHSGWDKILRMTPVGMAIGAVTQKEIKTTEDTGLLGPRTLAHSPEFRGSQANTTSNTVAPTVNIGPVTQSPGESGTGFAQRVSDLVKGHIQGMLEPAAAATAR